MPKYVVGQAMNFLGVDLFIKKILQLHILYGRAFAYNW